MTCIVGMERNGSIYMGADSCASSGNYNQVVKDKIFEKDGYMMGIAGRVRMCSFLRYCFSPPQIPKKKDITEFMATTFTRKLRKDLCNEGFLEIEDNVQSLVESVCMIGARGKLFQINTDFSIQESEDNFMTIGSGRQAAKGAYYALKAYVESGGDHMDDLLCIPLLRLTLEAAEKTDMHVRSPFRFLYKERDGQG